MRLAPIAAGFLIAISSATAAGAATDVDAGIGRVGGDANIRGHFSTDSDVLPRSGSVADDKCYATYMRYDRSLVSLAARCDQVPDTINFAPLAPAPEQQTAAQATAVVRDYIRTLSMPVPAPTMSAPEGITGARHSLDQHMEAARTFPVEDTSFGQLRATAHGRFTVDWGDGTKNSYTNTGAPWPNSAISHVWTTTGSYGITVTAQWNLDWSLGGYSGVITGLQTTANIPNWHVIEAQAVLIR